jgi:hypothetical protein
MQVDRAKQLDRSPTNRPTKRQTIMHSKLISRLLEVRQTVRGNVKVLTADINFQYIKNGSLISLSQVTLNNFFAGTLTCVMLLNERNKLKYK